MEEFSLDWLRDAGARGEIADVTGRLGGEKLWLDFPERGKGDSKLRLLKLSSLRDCADSGEILPEDLILIYAPDGSVLHAGTVTEDGRLRHIAGSVSARSVAAYCARWRKASGLKVLRKPWLPFRYTKRECFVPMRDGVRLYTSVYEAPEAGPKPIMMMRSPYPVGTYGYGGVGDLSDKIRCFTERGYIIVEQNVRGTFMSEGAFEDMRPPVGPGETGASCPATDEATDTYDTIEWLLKNTRNNGSVGIYGVSYPGFYATLSAICGHPALKAVSPQAPVTDWWMGDDAHHNGAFMLCDMYGFGGSFFREKDNPTPDAKDALFPVPEGADLYDFFRGKAIGDLLRPFLGEGTDIASGMAATGHPHPERLQGFADIVAHPGYDAFWQERNPLRHLHGVKPAVMVVGGFYDAEDAWGALHTYRALREQSPETESYFVYGPWTHGGWRKDAAFLEEVEMPFFEYYLEDKGTKPAWRELHMLSGEAFRNPMADSKLDLPIPGGSYVSDPASPVPYMDIQSPWRDKAYMWADQSFASGRPDVLSQTLAGPLAEPLTAIGPITIRLKFKAEPMNGSAVEALDADLVVKLIDAAPDGIQSLVRGDVFPARWRNSLSEPKALKAGEEAELSFEMADIHHRFEAGHSIMVQVQSSWFPLVAMNPQRFLRNPYTAVPADYIPLRITILPGSGITVGTRNL